MSALRFIAFFADRLKTASRFRQDRRDVERYLEILVSLRQITPPPVRVTPAKARAAAERHLQLKRVKYWLALQKRIQDLAEQKID